jgi:hypothetical protein
VRIGLAALVVVAAAVFGVVQLLGGDDGDGDGGAEPIDAVGLSESELLDRADDLDHVAYWVGPDPTAEQYELTSTADGRIYIRYLTAGAEPGVELPSFLSVGTYPVPDALQALRDSEAAGGTKGLSREDGYWMLQGGSGQNVYVVFDHQPDLQIEIFDPMPGGALKLARSAALRPLG